MLELTREELEKLISTLKWVDIATLGSEEEKQTLQNLIQKINILLKTASKDKFKVKVL